MVGVVYRLVAPNGKSYIGLTTNLRKRLVEHRSTANKLDGENVSGGG